MLARSSLRGAVRPTARWPRSNLTTPVRQLSLASRPSAVALGKRPQIPTRSSLTSSPSIAQTRHLSWIPWRSSKQEPSPVVEASITAPTPVAESSSASLSSSPIPETGSLPNASSLDALSTTPTPEAAALLPQSPALPSVPSLQELIANAPGALQDVLNSPEAVYAAMKTADLNLMGLQHGWFSLPGWTRDALVGVHEISGLPWWATIAAFTVAIRVCLVPLVVRLQAHNTRLAAVQPQMNALFKRLQDSKIKGDQAAQTVVAGALSNLMREHNVSPFRPFLLPLVQMPFFLSMFSALRSFASTPIPQLKEGGFSWVTDLTVPDPYYILPITSIALTNLVFKYGADGTGATQNASNMRHFKNVIQMVSIVSIPFIGQMPAAVLFYWTFTNAFTLLQAVTLRQPFIKRLLRLPTPPPVEAPPEGTAPPKDPSWGETVRAGRSFFSDRLEQARQQSQEIHAQQERQKGLRKGTALMTERVKEAGSAGASGFLEEGAGNPPGPAGPGVVSKELARRQRIAAAREKRERR